MTHGAPERQRPPARRQRNRAMDVAATGQKMNGAVLLRMDDYTTRAKAYWWATALLGVAALAVAVTNVAALKPSAIVQVVLGTLFAAITGLFPVRVPGAKTSGSVAEIFVFLLLLDF